MAFFSGLTYSIGEEDTRVELAALPEDVGHVLAVAGSGSRVVPLLARRPRYVTCIDVNPTQLALTRLRLTALERMEWDDYLGFLGYPPNPWNAQRRERAFALLPLGQDDRAAIRPILERRSWGPIIYAGRFEGMLRQLAYVNRLVTGSDGARIFECPTLSEQREYVRHGFPHKRWRILLEVLANSTVLNAILYRGKFPKKNLEQSTLDIYSGVFRRLFANVLARESFFLQLIFFGELRFVVGCPVECDAAIFADAKQAVRDTRIECRMASFLEPARSRGTYDFVSASDVPSFLSDGEATLYLQRLRPSLARNALVVTRGHLRVVRPMADGFHDATHTFAPVIASESTQLWTIQVHQHDPH